jgi:hypothetical protein
LCFRCKTGLVFIGKFHFASCLFCLFSLVNLSLLLAPPPHSFLSAVDFPVTGCPMRPDFPAYSDFGLRVPGSVSKFVRYKKNQTLVIPSNFVKFGKIWYNSAEFRLEEVLYSKNPKNQKSAEFAD